VRLCGGVVHRFRLDLTPLPVLGGKPLVIGDPGSDRRRRAR
jgi:hypothetical protein